MCRVIILVSVISLALILGVFGYAQEGSRQESMVLEGRIVAIDWVASIIVVRWLAPNQYRYDEVSFFVPDNTIITRGTDTIGLVDLEPTNNVKVEYYNSSPGPLVVTRIMVYI